MLESKSRVRYIAVSKARSVVYKLEDSDHLRSLIKNIIVADTADACFVANEQVYKPIQYSIGSKLADFEPATSTVLPTPTADVWLTAITTCLLTRLRGDIRRKVLDVLADRPCAVSVYLQDTLLAINTVCVDHRLVLCPFITGISQLTSQAFYTLLNVLANIGRVYSSITPKLIVPESALVSAIADEANATRWMLDGCLGLDMYPSDISMYLGGNQEGDV